MKRTTSLIGVIAALSLSGCMSTGDSSASLVGMNFESMTCDEIEDAFESYRNSRDNVNMFTNLASAVGVNTSAVDGAKVQADQLYIQAVNTARPIAELKGCVITI